VINLTARDALSEYFTRVPVDSRAPLRDIARRNETVFAVFDESDGSHGPAIFLGLVEGRRAALYPQRIFADLLPRSQPDPLALDAPLEQAQRRLLEEAAYALPVLDVSGELIGAVTRDIVLTLLHYGSRGSCSPSERQMPRIGSAVTRATTAGFGDGPVVSRGNTARPLAGGRDVVSDPLRRERVAHQKTKQELKRVRAELATERQVAVRKTAALDELLNQLRSVKVEFEARVAANIELVANPIIEQIATHVSSADRHHLRALSQCLGTICSELGVRLRQASPCLAPREVEICTMIRDGLTSKEIAHTLCLSPRTIETHRRNIRKKLGITRTGSHLTSYLRTLDTW